jgi:2-keto-3-deoxy-L-rhamnonate aldolase RhmA
MTHGSDPAAKPTWENPIKQLLRQGEAVVGGTLTTTSLDVAARMATVGFDFLWVEMEHSPITLETLRNVVLATRGLPAVPFARVPVNETWMAKRVLDAGVHGVIFPFTRTAAMARQAADACRYPPTGRRGSGASLATACWPEPDCYYDSADRNIVVVAIVEEVAALDELDAIAATEGIDVVFLGTGDLSFSLGLRGRQDDERIEAAASAVVAATKRHGKAAGRPAANATQLQRFMDQGFRFFQAATDLGLLEAGARHLLGQARAGGTSRPEKPLY